MLSQNDDYPDLKQARDYHDMQFLITTGPGGSRCRWMQQGRLPNRDCLLNLAAQMRTRQTLGQLPMAIMTMCV